MLKALISKDHLFTTALVLSLAGHVLAFSLWRGGGSDDVDYRVEVGPNTFEVVSLHQVGTPEPPKARLGKQTVTSPQQAPVFVPKSSGAEPRQQPISAKQNPAPNYPKQARKQGFEGTVRLRVLVNSSGQAQQVDIKQTSGYEILDEAAKRTVAKWEFEPARRGSIKLNSWIEIPIQFSLVND